MSPRTVSRRTRTPLVDIQKEFHDFLHNWAVATDAGNLRDKAKGKIKKWFETGGDGEVTVNGNGSQFSEFEVPLEIDGRKITGLENRRSATPRLDVDKVDAWLESLPQAQREKLSARLYERVVDYRFKEDELYALNQEGIVPDDLLDPNNDGGFITTDVTWSLHVTKAL